jgi:hypothetical protein
MRLKISPVFSLILALALGTVMTSMGTYAAEKSQPESAEASDEPTQEQIFDMALADIEDEKRVIADLDSRVDKASGILQVALESRLSKAKMSP